MGLLRHVLIYSLGNGVSLLSITTGCRMGSCGSAALWRWGR